jgi:hypothetical protein
MKDRIRIIDGETYLMLNDVEALAIISHGKYREDRPFWRRFGDRVGALVSGQLKAWREGRVSTGNRLKD